MYCFWSESELYKRYDKWQSLSSWFGTLTIPLFAIYFQQLYNMAGYIYRWTIGVHALASVGSTGRAGFYLDLQMDHLGGISHSTLRKIAKNYSGVKRSFYIHTDAAVAIL